MSAEDVFGWIVIAGVVVVAVVTMRGGSRSRRDPRWEALLEAKEWNEEVSRRIGRASVVLRSEGEPERDVTEDVVSVLDALYASMDWGSGFLEDHEIESATRLMRALGFSIEMGGLRGPIYERPPDLEPPA